MQNGEQVAPKINLVNWNCRMELSIIQRKRRADWSSCLTAICIIIPSMSNKTATGCSLNLNSTPTKLFSKSGPVRRFESSDSPWKFDAALATLLTFPGLFGLVTGWWGKYYIDSEDGACISIGLTKFLSKSVWSVWLYFWLRPGSFCSRFFSLFSWLTAEKQLFWSFFTGFKGRPIRYL